MEVSNCFSLQNSFIVVIVVVLFQRNPIWRCERGTDKNVKLRSEGIKIKGGSMFLSHYTTFSQ